MNAQVTPVQEKLQRPVRNPADPDMEGRAVVDDARDVEGDRFSHRACGRMNVLNDRGLDRYNLVDPCS